MGILGREKVLELNGSKERRMPKKKLEKNLAHARMVWAREQMQAAQALETLEKAMEQVRENAESIPPEDLQVIEGKYEEQKSEIQNFVLKARDKFVTKVGPENADLGLELDA
jgi:flagellar biosynthesis GTPase FlhF